MTIQPKHLAPITFVCDVAVDGYSPVPFLAGETYASQVVDRTASPTFAEYVTLSFGSDDETLSGDVDIYVYGDIGPGGTPSEFDENWNYWQVTQANIATPKWSVSANLWGQPLTSLPLKLIGTLTLSGPGWYRRPFVFNVATAFGGVVPPRWAVVVHNKSSHGLFGEGPNGQRAWGQAVGMVAESV